MSTVPDAGAGRRLTLPSLSPDRSDAGVETHARLALDDHGAIVERRAKPTFSANALAALRDPTTIADRAKALRAETASGRLADAIGATAISAAGHAALQRMLGADVTDYPRIRDALLAVPPAEREIVCCQFEASFKAKHGLALAADPTFFALLERHARGPLREPANEAELRAFVEKACRPAPQDLALVPKNPVAQLERCMEKLADVHRAQKELADRLEAGHDPRGTFTRVYQHVTEEIARAACVDGLSNPWLELRSIEKFHRYYDDAIVAEDRHRADPSRWPPPEGHWGAAFEKIRRDEQRVFETQHVDAWVPATLLPAIRAHVHGDLSRGIRDAYVELYPTEEARRAAPLGAFRPEFMGMGSRHGVFQKAQDRFLRDDAGRVAPPGGRLGLRAGAELPDGTFDLVTSLALKFDMQESRGQAFDDAVVRVARGER